MRRFKKVPKDKEFPDIPSKYLAGSKNKKKRAAEIRRTRRLYKEGNLTGADFDRISRMRGKG